MPARDVTRCRAAFEGRLNSLLQLALDSAKFFLRSTSGSYQSIGARRRESILGLVLLQSHLAWEEFLERTFVRYMCGASTDVGYAPTLLQQVQPNHASAMTRLLQRCGGRQGNYVKWDDASVTNYARHFFTQGDPYVNSIQGITAQSNGLVTVRNRIAHRSEHSHNQFRAVVRDRFTYVPRGMTPGRFLASAAPFGGPGTMLEHYISAYKTAATQIVP